MKKQAVSSLSGGVRPGRRVLAWGLALLLPSLSVHGLVPPLLGQNTPQETETRAIPKDQIPLYSVVSEYFVMMGHFKNAAPLIYLKRVRAIGIEPGQPTGRAFDAAVEAAREVIAKPTVDYSLSDSPEQFEAFQQKAIREKARELGQVYGGLLADLEARGFDPESFRTYIDETVRPSVSFSVEVPRGRDPVDELLASPTAQSLRVFDAIAEAAYRRGATNMTKAE